MDEQTKQRIIRDAATIVLLRKKADTYEVLMGQRGAEAAFMPNKYVFPGGALDPVDFEVKPATNLSDFDRHKLSLRSEKDIGDVLAMTAIRELWEETGLMLGQLTQEEHDVPDDWKGFYEKGIAPKADALHFMFRAITPPGRTRRFDARFFIAYSDDVLGADDDFSAASDELSHLHWIMLSEAKSLDLPLITRVVLSEVDSIIEKGGCIEDITFFHHDGERTHFTIL